MSDINLTGQDAERAQFQEILNQIADFIENTTLSEEELENMMEQMLPVTE